MTPAKQIEVTILGQQYRLACQPEAEPALLEAVARVDAEMHKVRATNPVRGQDRVAVMAALSIASELLKLQQSVRFGDAVPVDEIKRTMGEINARVGTAIDNLERY
jgi:cell division protein ZapA